MPERTVDHTADGHHVVIDGRKWRATDPAIPEPEAAVLRKWLMSGRRAVGTAKKAGDADAESTARARVHAAKTALGERGPEWWEQSDADRRDRWREGLRQARDAGFDVPEDVELPPTEQNSSTSNT